MVLLNALAALAGCGQAGTPGASGVCWRAGPATPGKVAFTPLARGVTSLDDCAAMLEAVRLEGAPRADGAFQGYFIFVDARQVASSESPRGFRYPIFQPGQRAEIDADLRGLIRDRGGRPPTPGDIAVQRR
ncbi:MAG: hypothetical protein ABI376_08225 [Caulobacteraceae bacterium]